MRTVAMCFSLLPFPKCKVPRLANSWWEGFHNLTWSGGNNSRFMFLSSYNYGIEAGNYRRWTRRPVTTKTEASDKNTPSSKTTESRWVISQGTLTTRTQLNIKKEISEFERSQYCDNQQQTVESKNLAKLVTAIVFDIETTGFSRENERIIEIALHDLLGGENSTFQTLINPERCVPNPHIHGISTYMVNRPDVPRMNDLIPILVQYIRSRQKPGGVVLWIAHNARCFDVPFLIKEFSRCSFEIPPDWLFVDTLPLAREVMKSRGSKLPLKLSLQDLCEHYGIPLVGSAHRAMSDVYSLSLVLQRMTFDLKLPVSGLVERSFRASDLINLKKKTKKKSTS